MLYFATYFDKNYLSRGLVLYDSLKKHSNEFELYILCLDEYTKAYFQKNASDYPEIEIVSLNEIENEDKELSACKSNRSIIEYYFTLSPCLPLYLLKKYKLSHICSLDADIMFYSDPKPLFEYLKTYSIVITPHKFSPEVEYLKEYGIFNVSFQIFKNDTTGINCLNKWRAQCIEWCYDYFDKASNRFADQKYLDNWTILYPGKVKSLDDNISGLAPWNLNNFTLTNKHGNFYSQGEKIIFYHFHDFKLFHKSWASNGFNAYKVKINRVIDQLYLKYWNNINAKNSVFGFKKDMSKRYNISQTLSYKLQRNPYAYFNLFGIMLLHVNYLQTCNLTKKIIFKLYG